jgi:AcrR family transcriptional regulator
MRAGTLSHLWERYLFRWCFSNFQQSRRSQAARYPARMRALPGKASRVPPGPQPVSREASAEDQRRRILAATAELMAKRGYQGTTTELIVRRAKVGYATFYKQFGDKEGALAALFDLAAARGREIFRATLRDADGSWAEKVARGIRALFEQIAAHPAVARVCLVEALTAGPGMVARYEEVLVSFEPMLRPGRALNPRGEELPQSLEKTLAGGILWLAYQRLILGEAGKLLELLPEAVEFVLSPYVGEAEAVRTADELFPDAAGAPV